MAAPEVALAVAAGGFITWYENGRRRKRRITSSDAAARSSAPPLPNTRHSDPRTAGPNRRNFGPSSISDNNSMPARSRTAAKRRKVSKSVKATKGKRTVKRTSSKKKPSKKKKSVNYATTIKQEVHGVMDRNHVSYFGFQATAGSLELFKVAADAILRANLKKHRVSIRRTDEAVPVVTSVPNFSKQLVGYARTRYDLGSNENDVSGAMIDYSSGSYESKVLAFATELQDKVLNGYYPIYMIAYAGNGTAVTTNRKLGDAKLNLAVKRVIKLRNITRTGAGARY